LSTMDLHQPGIPSRSAHSTIKNWRIFLNPLRTNQPNSTPLLIYGRDLTLLGTRRLVLEIAGFAVHTVAALDDVQTKIASNAAYAMLIICHTAPAEECRALVTLAGQSEIPVYQIESLITPTALIQLASKAKR
jgi:hypothetical protein